MDEPASHSHPLPLAARESIRKRISSIAEADRGECLAAALLLLSFHGALELERKQEILDHRQGRQQIEELEDEADVSAAEDRPLPLAEPGEIGSRDDDAAGIGLVDPRQEVQQSRFAGTALAQKHDQLAPLDAKIDPVEDHVASIAFAVALGDPNQLDRWRCRRRFAVWLRLLFVHVLCAPG
jgi:hypothetical protein